MARRSWSTQPTRKYMAMVIVSILRGRQVFDPARFNDQPRTAYVVLDQARGEVSTLSMPPLDVTPPPVLRVENKRMRQTNDRVEVLEISDQPRRTLFPGLLHLTIRLSDRNRCSDAQ